MNISHLLLCFFLFSRQLICPLEGCKKKGRSKMHTLLSKARPLCLHTILAITADASGDKKEIKTVEHLIDYRGTVEYVIEQIQSNFPTSFRSLEEGKFLSASKTFVDKMITSDESLINSLQCVPANCCRCCCKWIIIFITNTQIKWNAFEVQIYRMVAVYALGCVIKVKSIIRAIAMLWICPKIFLSVLPIREGLPPPHKSISKGGSLNSSRYLKEAHQNHLFTI